MKKSILNLLALPVIVALTMTAAHAGYGKADAAKSDIVDTAVAAGSFKTLAAALDAAGLVDTLKGAGPFTVFAPTDEAFAALPAGTVEELLKPENKDQLIAILTYHVVPGRVLASDVVKISSAKTVNGKSVAVKVSDAGVMVDNAKVVGTDIETSNGVIHVIDSVILPPADEAMAEEAMAEEAAPAEAMTEASAEAAPAEAASGDAAAEQAPERMPVTGGEQNNALGLIVAALALVVVGGLAFASRRRLA